MNNKTYETAAAAVALLNDNGFTVAVAESCTGGLLSSYLTAVPGVSAVYELGVTSYSCRIKNKILGVKEETLDAFGAVSENTAREMAEGVRQKAGSDIGLSVTGVAGPDGSEGHAPGLVFIAAADKGGTRVEKLNIDPINRETVRETAVKAVLELLIKTVEEVAK